MTNRVALVTGANRNIGLEVARQLAQQGMTVLIGARDAANGEAAAAALRAEGLDAQAVLIDVADDASVAAAAAAVTAASGRLDVLVNNANVGFDWTTRASEADLEEVKALLDNNAFGAWRTTKAFLGLLRASPSARVVNVTSEAGSFGTPTGLSGHGGLIGYSLGKTLLNALTVKLAKDLEETSIKVNAASPGFVATTPQAEKMGGRPVPEGAASIVWTVNLPDDGPNGALFRDGEVLPW